MIQIKDKIIANIQGNADSATKATQDGSGNVITSTYATKTELNNGLAAKSDTGHNHDSAYLGKTAKAASASTADSATKATQDASGRVIIDTYATKAEVNNLITNINTLLDQINGEIV